MARRKGVPPFGRVALARRILTNAPTTCHCPNAFSRTRLLRAIAQTHSHECAYYVPLPERILTNAPTTCHCPNAFLRTRLLRAIAQTHSHECAYTCWKISEKLLGTAGGAAILGREVVFPCIAPLIVAPPMRGGRHEPVSSHVRPTRSNWKRSPSTSPKNHRHAKRNLPSTRCGQRTDEEPCTRISRAQGIAGHAQAHARQGSRHSDVHW